MGRAKQSYQASLNDLDSGSESSNPSFTIENTKSEFYGNANEIPWDLLETKTGKGTEAYNAHPYPTKLSLDICRLLIRQFSKTNELVLDPFAGSGMVGIASLLEHRRAILSDLSPYAVHISSSLTKQTDVKSFDSAAKKVVDDTRKTVFDLVTTIDRTSKEDVEFNYLIWSENIECNYCKKTFCLWDVALEANGKIKNYFHCPFCNENLDKKNTDRKGMVPVEIVYKSKIGEKQTRIKPSNRDMELACFPKEPRSNSVPWRPTNTMMNLPAGQRWGEQWRSGYHSNVVRVEDFYSKRNWIILGYLWEAIEREENNDLRKLLRLAFTGTLVNSSRMVRYTFTRGGRSNTPGTLYFPMVWLEQNPLLVFERRVTRIIKHLTIINDVKPVDVQVRCSSATNLDYLSDNSVDLIVTDPPFGSNIQYAELSFIAECWLKNFTQLKLEAVENPFRKQKRDHYLNMMKLSLKESYRILKKGRYLILFFNNTDIELWRDLRTMIDELGFIIVKSVPNSKGHGGWNQVVHKETATAWDPIIFLWKPNDKNTIHKAVNTYSDQKELIKCLIADASRKNISNQYLHQHLYSQYISAWFDGKISRDLIHIKDFISIVKKLSSNDEV